MKTWKTELCNEEQHVVVFEVTSPSLVEVISLWSVFSGVIFPETYVSLVLFHDLKKHADKIYKYFCMLLIHKAF